MMAPLEAMAGTGGVHVGLQIAVRKLNADTSIDEFSGFTRHRPRTLLCQLQTRLQTLQPLLHSVVRPRLRQ